MIHTHKVSKEGIIHWILSCTSGIRRILPIHIACQRILITFFPRARNLLKSLELCQFVLVVIQGFDVETSNYKNA